MGRGERAPPIASNILLGLAPLDPPYKKSQTLRMTDFLARSKTSTRSSLALDPLGCLTLRYSPYYGKIVDIEGCLPDYPILCELSPP